MTQNLVLVKRSRVVHKLAMPLTQDAKYTILGALLLFGFTVYSRHVLADGEEGHAKSVGGGINDEIIRVLSPYPQLRKRGFFINFFLQSCSTSTSAKISRLLCTVASTSCVSWNLFSVADFFQKPFDKRAPSKSEGDIHVVSCRCARLLLHHSPIIVNIDKKDLERKFSQ